jgi:hypothetical protein
LNAARVVPDAIMLQPAWMLDETHIPKTFRGA